MGLVPGKKLICLPRHTNTHCTFILESFLLTWCVRNYDLLCDFAHETSTKNYIEVSNWNGIDFSSRIFFIRCMLSINEYVWSKKYWYAIFFVESLQFWASDQQADDRSKSSAYFRVVWQNQSFRKQTAANTIFESTVWRFSNQNFYYYFTRWHRRQLNIPLASLVYVQS